MNSNTKSPQKTNPSTLTKYQLNFTSTLNGVEENIEEEVKRWDERFFNLVKEQGQTARTIIITAASVVVLSPVLGAVVELVEKFMLP